MLKISKKFNSDGTILIIIGDFGLEEINKLRKKINSIDSDLVELIDQRAITAKKIGEIKLKNNMSVVQLGREKEVLSNISAKFSSIPPESGQLIWKEIMSACKLVQGKKTRICYLGPEGTFTQIATERYFPKAGSEFIAVQNKHEVFKQIEGNYCDFGVIPIENSLVGSVRESMDLLIEQNLKIFGEIEIRIVHNLIGHKGTAPSDIKTIISHPQALSQCSDWILKNHPNANLEESSSTARAIRDIADMKLKPGECAAIGTEVAAKLNNLDVFFRGIENTSHNYTRFLIISKKNNIPTDRDKTSIVFVTKHTPGALYGVLKLFADAGINLLKIESRPRKNVKFEYVFICDFEGNEIDEKIKNTLEEIQNYTIWLKVLGSYPMFNNS